MAKHTLSLEYIESIGEKARWYRETEGPSNYATDLNEIYRAFEALWRELHERPIDKIERALEYLEIEERFWIETTNVTRAANELRSYLYGDRRKSPPQNS